MIVDLNDLKVFQFELFSEQKGITHFITTRQGGVSSGNLESLNFGGTVVDSINNLKENYQRLLNALNIERRQLIIPHQTHTNQVALLKYPDQFPSLGNIDALVTNLKDIAIAVLVADCVPVILYDPVKKVTGVVHSGWRGTCSRILTATIDSMISAFNCNPPDILAGIGPSIGPESYEVGSEVIEAFSNAFDDSDDFIRYLPNGKGVLDLWTANQLQLKKLGLKKENVEMAGICTYSNSDNFFSARKANPQKSGRFMAGIIMRS